MKIKKLTEYQKKQLNIYRDKWIEIGRCTDPANRIKAENAINNVYELAGIKKPDQIIWCDSPLSAIMTKECVKEFLKIKDSIRVSIRNSVWASVGDSVEGSVEDSVWDSVWDSIRVSVRDSVEDSVWDSIRDSIRDSAGASVRDSVEGSVRDFCYGQHDAYWLGFYEYFRDILELKTETKQATGLIDLSKHAGWFLPYENICFISERHNFLKFNDNNQLHNEIGPAISYPDGWSIYAWNGIVIPSKWIESKQDLTPEIALKWENIEQRRCACEIIGWTNVIKKLNPVYVNKDPNPEIGELLEIDLPDSGREKFLKVMCGTGREFAIPVPPEMKTARQANLWTYGLDDKQINLPEIRT